MEVDEKNKSETINLICSLLENKKTYVELSQLLRDFEKEAGHSLPLFGHGTILQFLRSISNEIQVLLVEEDIYVKIATEESADLGNDHTRGVENELKEIDSSLAESPAAGSSSRDIPGEGKSIKESKTEMTNKERGENTSGNVNFTSPCGTEEGDKGEKSKEKEVENDEVLSSISELLKDEPEYEPCIDMCLSNLLLSESDIPLINLKDYANVSDCIRVAVPEVRSPHRFILQLKKFQSELTIMMRKMLTFYNVFSKKYALGNYKFERNQVCAALYPTNPRGKEWYRAKIINFNTRSSTVLLIDYGIVTDVINTNIKYLDRDFGHLPVQALNGHLANIKPYRGKYWSEDCCKRFLDFVFEEDLVAQVIKMDTERQWLSVILSYAGANGFLINDNLVKGKFPVADCDYNEEESFFPVFYDSINPKQFVQPEDLGKTRRLKSEFRDSEKWESEITVPHECRDKEPGASDSDFPCSE